MLLPYNIPFYKNTVLFIFPFFLSGVLCVMSCQLAAGFTYGAIWEFGLEVLISHWKHSSKNKTSWPSTSMTIETCPCVRWVMSLGGLWWMPKRWCCFVLFFPKVQRAASNIMELQTAVRNGGRSVRTQGNRVFLWWSKIELDAIINRGSITQDIVSAAILAMMLLGACVII